MGKVCPLCIGHVIQYMHSDCESTINGILWEVTQEQIGIGSSNSVDRLTL